MYWLRAYLQTQHLPAGRVFFNFAAHDYNNVRLPLFAHHGIYNPFVLYAVAPNAPANYYVNPELNQLHWPTVKATKDWDERNVKNGYTPLQLLDAPNPHMLSKKEVQIYYKQTNGGDVLVSQGILAKNQCSSITLSGHRCNNLCVIGIEYCWLHLAILFHLELKQSTQRNATIKDIN